MLQPHTSHPASGQPGGAQPQRAVVRALLILAVLTLLALAFAACVAPVPGGQVQFAPAPATPMETFGVLESVADYDVPPTPTPVPVADRALAVVNLTDTRANIRSGPGTGNAIVGKGNPGDTFEILARNENDTWYQVCCVQGADDPEGQAETSGWVSATIVDVINEGEEIPVAVAEDAEPVLRPDLAATWNVDWTCESERCTVPACAATVTATVTRNATAQAIPVEHQVEWDDECFDTDVWVFELDPLTGSERTGEFAENFLYSYWAGANPGAMSGVFPFDDRGILVNCAGPQTVEVEEGDGWTSVYEGVTCHDLRTGVLVYMRYEKQWLYTGEFDGEQYERAFFGDVERVEQTLTDTNLDLEFVDRQ